jgi:hypothetical protein
MTFPTIDAAFGGGATGALAGSGSAFSGAATGALTGITSPGCNGSAVGGLAGSCGESATNSAVAELGNLISSLGSLSSQAQGLPLSAPTLPGLPQQSGYQPGVTDYTQFSGDND